MTTVIEVSIKKQILTLLKHGNEIKSYTISTALKGVGQEKNSFKTPKGRHIIRAMIGEGLPEFSIFEERRPTGQLWTQQITKLPFNHDWILSRILWLSGCEIGINRLGNFDTMQRYIYIHGTSDEFLLGTPVSHGCIRMANQDVIELFNLVSIGTAVLINEE
ncbi:MAG: L,D-transpeptidase [Methylophilaceae bacterium]